MRDMIVRNIFKNIGFIRFANANTYPLSILTKEWFRKQNFRHYYLQYIFTFIAIITTLTACRKAPEGFDMTYRRQFNLPLGLSTFQSHNFEFKDIAADTAVFFNIHNANSNTIQRIIPKAMNLRAIFATVETRYNFIDKVEVWISNPNDPKLTPQIVFFRDEVPLNIDTRLDLIPNNVDIKKFILAGRFNIRINLRIRDITTRTIETEWNAVFLAEQVL
jgi:hypothetical protein